MNTLSFVQRYVSRDINKIQYVDNLRYEREKGNLSKKLQIDYWSMIDPPPLNSEKITTADLTNVIRLANGRTKSETSLVISVDEDPMTIFMPIINRYNMSFPEQVFKQLYTYLREIIRDIKYFYNRARPEQLANFYGLPLDIVRSKTHLSPSYPSGHTAYASLIASILSDIYPQYVRDLWGVVDICGQCRMLQGVHFNTDNQASIELVKKVYIPLKEFDSSFLQ